MISLSIKTGQFALRIWKSASWEIDQNSYSHKTTLFADEIIFKSLSIYM